MPQRNDGRCPNPAEWLVVPNGENEPLGTRIGNRLNRCEAAAGWPDNWGESPRVVTICNKHAIELGVVW